MNDQHLWLFNGLIGVKEGNLVSMTYAEARQILREVRKVSQSFAF